MANEACKDGVREAFKDLLSDAEINTAFDKAALASKRIRAQGRLDDFEDRVISDIEREAEMTRVAAAMQRKHAALNAIIRDRLDNHIDTLMSEGLTAQQSILAYMEGSTRSVELGRVSVYAQRQAFERKYIGGMVAELERDAPHVKRLTEDKPFADDVVREMTEIKKDGDPGVTGNKDARIVADIFAKYAEVSRVDLNKNGAFIGKLDGWGGPHRHDKTRMIKVDEATWVREITPKLDLARTFPDIETPAEIEKILTSVYRNIITGQEERLTAKATGQITGPANLAKSLNKSRVLHFKNANAWITYNDSFGDGNIMNGMISHLQRAAAHAAQMSTLGPNPRIMLDAKLDNLRRGIKDSDLSSAEKVKAIRRLQLNDAPGGAISNAFLEMQGMTMSPDSYSAAQINQGVRNFLNLTSLGGATLTAVPTDLVTSGLAAMQRGGGFVRGFTGTLGELLSRRNVKDRKEIATLIGEGFDGMVTGISSSHYVHDGVPGAGAKLTEQFFKWNGLTPFTDAARGANARMVASEMAMRNKTAFSKLPAPYQDLLGRHGIGVKEWNAIRSVQMRMVNEVSYTTPDLMRSIGDAKLEPIIAQKMADIRSVTSDPARIERARTRFLNEARDDLEMSTSRLFADEVSFGVVETDAASRRWALQGTRPGTLTGEAARYIMQFKGFPLAFTQRVLGRAGNSLRGPDKAAALRHIGTGVAALTAAGYASMTMKDIVKGQWPPRDPADPRVMLAAMVQGGAFGLYGDFLFGQVNRFGNSPLETLAGPALSKGSSIANLILKARDGDATAAQAIGQAIRLTPFNNLWYAKPALDALIFMPAKEWASPGYRRRQERRLRKDFGQERLF